MWANAQRDGRPAEYRWCPLFNAAKFGCRSACLSVCYSSEHYKTAEPIEMPFGMRAPVGPGKYVLDGGADLPMGRGKSEGKGVPL